MGYKLRREVRDALPPGVLTAAERLLVLELADICGDDTREGWPGVAKLAELTDLSERSIQETMARVGRKWIELRVPLGVKDGRIYYAYAGKRTTYRFPPLTPRGGATDRGSLDATDPGSSEPNGAMDPGERCDGSVPMVRQIRDPSPSRTSKINHSSLSVADTAPTQQAERENEEAPPRSKTHTLILDAGCPDGQLDDVEEELRRRFEIRSPQWFRTVAGNDELAGHVADVLEALNPKVEITPIQSANAHPFDADTSGISCVRCGTPQQNGMHRVGSQGVGYIAKRARSPADQRVAEGAVLYAKYRLLEESA